MRRCSPMSQVLGLKLEVPGTAIASSSRLKAESRGTLQLRRTVVCQARAGRSWPDPNHKPSESETQGIWGDAASKAAAAASQATAAAAAVPIQDKKPSPWDAATGGTGTPWSATPTTASTTTNQTSSWSSSTQNREPNSVLSGSQRASPVAPAAWKESPSSAGGEWLGKQIAAAEARKKQEAENAATGDATGKAEGAAPAKKVVRMWYDEGYERDEAGNIILTDEQRTAIIEELRRKYAPKFAAAGPLPQPQPQPQSSSTSAPSPSSPAPARPAPTRPPSMQVVGGGYADRRPAPPPRPTPTRPPSMQVIPGGYADSNPAPPLNSWGNSAPTAGFPAQGPVVGRDPKPLNSAATTGSSAQGPVVGQDGKPLNELEQLDLKYADRWKNWKPRGGAPPPPPQPPREPFKSVLDTPMYDKDGRQLNELEVLDKAYADRWKNWKPRHGQGEHPDDVPRSQDTGNFAGKRQAWQASAPPRSTGTWNAPPANAPPNSAPNPPPNAPPNAPPNPPPNAPSARSPNVWNQPITPSPARNQPGTRSGPAGDDSESPGAWIRRELYGSQEGGVVGTGGPWFGGEYFNNQPSAAAGTGTATRTAAGAGGPMFGGQAAQAQNSAAATRPSFPGEAQSPSAGTGGPRFGYQAAASSPSSFAGQAGQAGQTGPRFSGNSVPATGSPAATSPPPSYWNNAPATRSSPVTSPSFRYGSNPAPPTGSPPATSPPPPHWTNAPSARNPPVTSPSFSYGNDPAPPTGSPAATSPPPSYWNNAPPARSPPATSSSFSYGNNPTGSPAATSPSPSYGSSPAQGDPSFRSANGPRDNFQSAYGGSAPYQKPFNAYWSKSTGSQPRPPPGPAWSQTFGDGADAIEGAIRPAPSAPTPAPEPDGEPVGNVQEAS